MAAAVMAKSACLCGLGTSPPAVVNGGQSSVSRSLGASSVSLPLVRASSVLLQADWRRSDAGHYSRVNFGSIVTSRPAARPMVTRSAIADFPSVPKRPLELYMYTVRDFMTRRDDLICASPSTSVDEALDILVEKRITGLPVVDETGKLVGVVSDYDLLALDSISGKWKDKDDGSLFPAASSSWKSFQEIQVLLGKTHGKTVGELMSPSPLVVREMTNIEDAARILLDTKFRRLPVISEAGKLVGLLTRANVVTAALVIKRLNETHNA